MGFLYQSSHLLEREEQCLPSKRAQTEEALVQSLSVLGTPALTPVSFLLPEPFRLI